MAFGNPGTFVSLTRPTSPIAGHTFWFDANTPPGIIKGWTGSEDVNLSAASFTSLTVREADGNPSISNVTQITVTNGTLTNNGGGAVTIQTGGGAGAGNLSNPLEDTKGSADTPDDEFTDANLDPKWTIAQGSAGVVSLFAGSTSGIYDLSARTSWLMTQVESGKDVRLRQDYMLPDNASILVSLVPALNAGGASATVPGVANGEWQVWLMLNDHDSGPAGAPVGGAFFAASLNNAFAVFLDTNANQFGFNCFRYQNSTPTALGAAQFVTNWLHGGRTYLRIDRQALTYYGFYSVDGFAYFPLGSFTHTNTLDNIWVAFTSGADPGDPLPIGGIDWIRQGTSSLDPW